MTVQSNAELYPCLYCNGHEDKTDCIEAIKKEAQQQLLKELLEVKQGLWTDKASDGNEYRLWAVPKSAIQNKLEGLEQ